MIPNNKKRNYDIWADDSKDVKEEYHEWSETRKIRTNKRSKYVPSYLPPLDPPTNADSYNPDEVAHQRKVVEAINEQIHARKEYDSVEKRVKPPKKNDKNSMIYGLKSFSKEELEELAQPKERDIHEKDENDSSDEESSEDDGEGEVRHRTNTEINKERRKKRNIGLAKKQKRRKERKLISFDTHLDNAKEAVKQQEEKEKKGLVRHERKLKKEKIKTKKLGNVGHIDEDIDVLLPEDLPSALREVSGRKNSAQSHLNRIQKRNIIEPRKTQPVHLSKFAPKIYEKAAAKAYLAKDMEKYFGDEKK